MSSFIRKSGIMNCPETPTAVGGHSSLLGLLSEVLK